MDRRANLNTLGDCFLGPLYEAIPVFLLGEPGFRFDRYRQDVRLRGLELRVGRIIPMRIAPELFGRSTRFCGVLLCHARSLCRVLCFAGLISRRPPFSLTLKTSEERRGGKECVCMGRYW